MFSRDCLAFCLIGLLLTALPVVGFAQDNSLPVVFEDYPPYEYVENGEIKGVNLEVAKEAFRRMGMTPTFEPRPWRRAVLQLQEGEILALSSGFKTPEREEFAYFPSEPLITEVNVIAVLDSSQLGANSIADLKGLSIGVVRGYTYGTKFDSFTDYHRIETQSMYQLMDMLTNKRMDAIVGNRDVIRHIARTRGIQDSIKFILEIGRDPMYLFFSKAHGEKAKKLAKDFGDAIREMHRDGTFKAIQDKY